MCCATRARSRTLCDAAAQCDRLVLLGDVLELRHGPERDALEVAREPLTRLGRRWDPIARW